MSASDLTDDDLLGHFEDGFDGFAGSMARDEARQQADQKESVRIRKVKNEEDLVQIYRNHGRSCWAWLVGVTAAYAGYAYLWDDSMHPLFFCTVALAPFGYGFALRHLMSRNS